MNFKIILLDYTETDIKSVQEVLENAQNYFMKVTGEVAGPDDGEEVFKALPENFDRNSKHVLGIYLDDVMIGVIDCLIGFPEPSKAHVGLLLINEKFQRKGLGKKIYLQLEEYLHEYTFLETIRLSVVETNKSVIKFWENCGFKLTGIVKPYSNKEVISQSLIMEKPFGTKNP